jgi:hypothetical protein
VTQASLFDTPADTNCPICHGTGYWRRHTHGRHPDTYPTIRCHRTAVPAVTDTEQDHQQ